MRKKLAIVLSSDLFIRNYLISGALSALYNNFDVFLIIEKDIKLPDVLIKSDVSFYESINFASQKKLISLFRLVSWKHRRRSKTFQFKFWIGYENKSIFRFLIQSIAWLYYSLMAFPVIYGVISSLKIKSLPINNSLFKSLKKINPNLVILPTKAFEHETLDLVRISKVLDFKTLYLMDNWDNLSSKTVFLRRPDHIGVWGGQSAEHAIAIQSFVEEQITCIGTPRFDHYLSSRKKKIDPLFSFKYILFIGTLKVFDEIYVLELINKIIENNKDRLGDLKIVYRPYPDLDRSYSSDLKNCSNIVVDPQLRDYFYKNTDSFYMHKEGWWINVGNNHSSMPSEEYLPGIIKNAEFLMGGITSMVVESLYFHKKFLVLAHDEKNNIWSPRNMLENFIHFDPLRNFDEIKICDSLADLEGLVLDLWDQREIRDKKQLDQKRRFICFDDNYSYAERLSHLCNKIL